MEDVHHNHKNTRLKKRISICEAIYSNLVLGNLQVKKELIKIEKSSWSGFEHKIYKQFLKRKEFFLQEINNFLRQDWEIERLNLTILAVLLEAIVEYEVFQTDPAILIHQSLLISKEYGEGEHKLVHAVINSYLKSKLKQAIKN